MQKLRKHAFDQEKSKIQEKKKENTPKTEKKVRCQDLDHASEQEKITSFKN